ncbi:MAG: hypothetical protein OEW62_00810 [Candidatus Bathyarchaeota archaeon]|nr:hypothetical protein [Candidatus Bathyarchaeota archaeon]MDH5745433.1 hypothetical protein [Candidatus Bathyarchaeota archaeon]
MKERVKAEKELTQAFRSFNEARFCSKDERASLYEKTIRHCYNSIEMVLRLKYNELAPRWLRMDTRARKKEAEKPSFSQILSKLEDWKAIEDPVLTRELRKVRNLRNVVMHLPESLSSIKPSDIEEMLQVAMHFVKIREPSRYYRIGEIVETKVQGILENSGIAFRREVKIDGYSTTSRVDFLLEIEAPVAIEVKHTTSRVGGFHFARELAFIATDLKRANPEMRFVVVISGDWSQRDLRILRSYCDQVIRLENLQKFLLTITN